MMDMYSFVLLGMGMVNGKGGVLSLAWLRQGPVASNFNGMRGVHWLGKIPLLNIIMARNWGAG